MITRSDQFLESYGELTVQNIPHDLPELDSKSKHVVAQGLEKIHDGLADIRELLTDTEKLSDDRFKEIFNDLEFRTLAPIRKFRLGLKIPYSKI